jgi:hypothetical protein
MNTFFLAEMCLCMAYIPWLVDQGCAMPCAGGAAERKLVSKDEPCVTAGQTLNSTESLSKFAAALETIGVLGTLPPFTFWPAQSLLTLSGCHKQCSPVAVMDD